MWGGGKLKLIAVIEEPAVIEKILTHLGLAAPPPRANARGVELFQGVGAEADGFYRCRGGAWSAHLQGTLCVVITTR